MRFSKVSVVSEADSAMSWRRSFLTWKSSRCSTWPLFTNALAYTT